MRKLICRIFGHSKKTYIAKYLMNPLGMKSGESPIIVNYRCCSRCGVGNKIQEDDHDGAIQEHIKHSAEKGFKKAMEAIRRAGSQPKQRKRR